MDCLAQVVSQLPIETKKRCHGGPALATPCLQCLVFRALGWYRAGYPSLTENLQETMGFPHSSCLFPINVPFNQSDDIWWSKESQNSENVWNWLGTMQSWPISQSLELSISIIYQIPGHSRPSVAIKSRDGIPQNFGLGSCGRAFCVFRRFLTRNM